MKLEPAPRGERGVMLHVVRPTPPRGNATEPSTAAERDAELVRRALAGEKSAFADIYRHHAAAVHRRITRILGRTHEVEDLVQRTFLEAFRSLARFRAESAFATWLQQIAIHVTMAALRAARRHPSTPVAPEDAELWADDASSPEEAFGTREQCLQILAQLDKLKPELQVAFVLRHVEGLGYDEIAELVGANAPAVAARVKKAERTLVDRLAHADARARRREGSTP